jgi:hypothetical protein
MGRGEVILEVADVKATGFPLLPSVIVGFLL